MRVNVDEACVEISSNAPLKPPDIVTDACPPRGPSFLLSFTLFPNLCFAQVTLFVLIV